MGELQKGTNSLLLQDDDLLQVFQGVSTRARELARCLETKQKRVNELRLRLGSLRQVMRDQQAATERAMREAFMERTRIGEAELAIGKAEAKAATHTTPTATARLERDAARETVVQLKLRVEILSAMAGVSPAGAALRQQYSRLSTLARQLSVELQGLNLQHRDLFDLKSAMDKDKSTRNTDHDLRLQLEARWLQLSVSLDNLSDGQHKLLEKKYTCASGSSALLSDTEERLHFLHQFLLDIKGVNLLLE